MAINIKILILVAQLNKNRRATSNIKTFCHVIKWYLFKTFFIRKSEYGNFLDSERSSIRKNNLDNPTYQKIKDLQLNHATLETFQD